MAIGIKAQAIDWSDKKVWIMVFAGLFLLYMLMGSGDTSATRQRSVTLTTRGTGQDIL